MPSSTTPVASRVVPIAEILTVGIPFCAFKLLTGMIALEALETLAPLGYLLLALGTVDLVLNVVNLVALLAIHHRIVPICVTDLVLRRRDNPAAGLGLAVDVFLSFAQVAVVVGFGLLRHLPPWALPIWNVAVVMNVLGAGVGRLVGAVRRAASRPSPVIT